MNEISVPEFIKELDVAINRIWEKPPVEIKKLKQRQRAYPLLPFTIINYAFHYCRGLMETISVMGRCADDNVLLENLKTITIEIIKEKCIYLEVVGLSDTVRFLRRICKVMESIQKVDDFTTICTKLAMYLGKLADRGWLDLEMHWSEVSSAYDLITSLSEK